MRGADPPERLGRHVLHHDYRDIHGAAADLAVLDPPWLTTNLGFDRGFDLGALLDFVADGTTPEATILLFGTFEMASIFSQRLEYRFEYIWVKPRGLGTRHSSKRPMRNHEIIYVFKKRDTRTSDLYFNRVALRRPGKAYKQRGIETDTEYSKSYNISPNPMTVNDGYREGLTVVYFNSKAAKNSFPDWERTDHPTQKPVKLVRMLVNAHCPPGGTVLDPTVGSGTTLVAAEQDGRTCIAAEIDPKYREMVRRRYGRTLFAFNEDGADINGGDGRTA